jgi:hypothetical protein
MRILGIPNTKHFHDITSIDEAKALYAKLKAEVDAESWRADAEEEFEDTEGNVLSRKVRKHAWLLQAMRGAVGRPFFFPPLTPCCPHPQPHGV